MEIKFISVGSGEYQAELALRNALLRKPIGLDLYLEDLSREDGDYHIGAFREGALVGCLILTPVGNENIKMRQVAVKEADQGLGIGSRLVAYSEGFAGAKGYSRIVLAARKTAVGFYERLGYGVIGDAFIEVGIPHFVMMKDLPVPHRGTPCPPHA